MRPVRFAIATLALLLLVGASPGREAERVSLVSLVASPREHDGKRVRTYGFLLVGEEMSALFLSKADADHTIPSNAIWLSSYKRVPQLTAASGNYVMIVGRFRAKNRGPSELFAGSIEAVEDFGILPDTSTPNQ